MGFYKRPLVTGAYMESLWSSGPIKAFGHRALYGKPLVIESYRGLWSPGPIRKPFGNRVIYRHWVIGSYRGLWSSGNIEAFGHLVI